MQKLTEQFKQKLFESESVKELLDNDLSEENGTFEVIASTEDVDRMGEVVRSDGWMLENFNKNPVILFGHDHGSLPIGKATSAEVRDRELIVKGVFASHENAQKVRKLYEEGIMKAVSVGFIPHEMDGNIITSAELLEVSFVPIPANSEALALAFDNEHSVNELAQKGFFDFDSVAKTSSPTEQKSEEGDEKGDEENRSTEGHNLPPTPPVEEKSDENPENEGDDEVGERSDEEKLVEKDNSDEEEEEEEETKETKSPACRQQDETQQECVDRKVPELMEEEGMEQDQAIAAAQSMCERDCVEDENGKAYVFEWKKVGELPKDENGNIDASAFPVYESEEKAGRVLSKANRSKVETAVEALKELLEADTDEGTEENSDAPEKGETEEFIERRRVRKELDRLLQQKLAEDRKEAPQHYKNNS